MARQALILVSLLFAILVTALAEPPKAAPDGTTSSSTPAADSPDSIGPVDDPAGADGGDDVVEGPVGGPTPLGEYAAAATAPMGSSGAVGLQISAGLGGAAAALAELLF